MTATSLVPSAELLSSYNQSPSNPIPSPSTMSLGDPGTIDEAERAGLSPRELPTNAFTVANPSPLLHRLENLCLCVL